MASFRKPKACGQTELPDRSVLKGQKLVENAKIEKFECDIFGWFLNTVCWSALLNTVKLYVSPCKWHKSKVDKDYNLDRKCRLIFFYAFERAAERISHLVLVRGFKVTNWRDRIKIAHLIFDDSVCTKPFRTSMGGWIFTHDLQRLRGSPLKLEVSIWRDNEYLK